MRGALLKSLMAMATLPVQQAPQQCARLVPRLLDQATPSSRLFSTTLALHRRKPCHKCRDDCVQKKTHDYSGRTKPPCQNLTCRCKLYVDNEHCDPWAGTRRGKKDQRIRKWERRLRGRQWRKYVPIGKPKCKD